MGHLGRDERHIATVFIACWLLLLVACLSRGPVQWILCALAVIGMIGTLVSAVLWPNSPQRLLVTVTGYQCEPGRVRLTGILAVGGRDEVYRPEVTFELLDSRKRVVEAKSFWPTGQTRRHVQPGFSSTFLVSLPVGEDAEQLVPRITCRDYPLTVTWAAAAGPRQPAGTVPADRLAAESDSLKGN